MRVSIVILSILSAFAAQAQLPQDPTVIAGDVSFHSTPDQLSIQQSTEKAIVNWREFSIGAGHTVDIRQPSASSVSLHRVIGKDPSRLAGTIRSNGTVFLVNRNGIAVGDGARIDINGGFLGTTRDITDADFMKGKHHFTGDSTSEIVIEERVERTSPGKWMAFVGADVTQKGTLLAASGHQTILAGAESFIIDLDGDSLLSFAVDPTQTSQSLSVQITSSGGIKGEDHHVFLTTQDTMDTARNVVNMEGVVEANRVDVTKDGTITLIGGAHSMVTVSGELKSQGRHGQGGTIKATGTKLVLTKDARVDVSGKAGGGKAFIGADIRGKSIPFAQETTVEAGAKIQADALENGDGGHIDFWGTRSLIVKASSSALGGALGGNGGFIETSTKARLDIEGALFNTKAPRGKTGTFLIDPINIAITSMAMILGPNDTSIDPAVIVAALASNNVVITTNGTFEGVGDPGGTHDGDNSTKNITIDSLLMVDTDHDLTLEAGNTIAFNENVIFAGRGNLFLRAGVASDTGTLVYGGGKTLTHNGYALSPEESGKIYLYYSTLDVSDPPTPFFPVNITTNNYIAYRWIKNDTDWSTIRDRWVSHSTSTFSYALRDNLTLNHTHVLPATDGQPYSGSFDGDGKTITIIRGVVQEGLFPSLFPVVRYEISDAELANVRNVTIHFGNYNGGLADVAPLVGHLQRGRVSDNIITIGTILTTGDCVGGVVARISAGGGQDTEVSRNQVTFTEISGDDFTGGIVGVNVGSHEVRILDNTITASGDLAGSQYVGGVQGDGQGTLERNVITISTITGSSYVGGIVGRKGTGTMLDNQATVGTITAAVSHAGGIAGVIGSGSTASNNIVSIDEILGADYVGGGFGQILLAGTFNNTMTVGLIEGVNAVGGIVGEIDLNGMSSGNILSGTTRIRANGSAVGGLVGHLKQGSLETCEGLPYIIQINPAAQGTGGMIGFATQGMVKNNVVEGVSVVPVAGKVGGLFGYVVDLDNLTILGVNSWHRNTTPLSEVTFNQLTLLNGSTYKRATQHIGDGDGANESENGQETWLLGAGQLKYVGAGDSVVIDIAELIPPVDNAVIEESNFANQVDIYTPLDDFAGEVGGGGESGGGAQEETITTTPNVNANNNNANATANTVVQAPPAAT